MTIMLLIVLLALALVGIGALAWWSSGRTKGRAPGPNPDGDIKHASAYFYRDNRGGNDLGGGIGL